MRKHLPLIDLVRFIAAAMVVLYHISGNYARLLPTDGLMSAAAFRSWLWGQSYVVIFFVVSGFCIHWPYALGKDLLMGEYYARRLIRVLVPLVVCAGVGRVLDLWYWAVPLHDSPPLFWSIFAELIYYTLYPALLPTLRNKGVGTLLAGSWMVAAGLIWLSPGRDEMLHGFGNSKTWIIGLPCWLTGVWLAQTLSRPAPSRSANSAWFWRFAVLAAAVLPHKADVNLAIYYGWSPGPLPFAMLVAPVCAFWLQSEMRTQGGALADLPSAIGSAGKAAYSIYLVHMPALQIAAWTGAEGIRFIVVALVATAAVATLFYHLVELTSCRFAAKIASSMSRRDRSVQASSTSPGVVTATPST